MMPINKPGIGVMVVLMRPAYCACLVRPRIKPRTAAMVVRLRRGAKSVAAKLRAVVHRARAADMALVSKPAAKQEVMASLALPALDKLVDKLVDNKHRAAMTIRTKTKLIEHYMPRGYRKLSLP